LVDGDLRLIELRQLGGALSRPAEGALSRLEGEALLYAVGDDTALTSLREAMAPWTAERTCLNFAEAPVDPATAFDGPVFRRLREVRSRLDPHGLFAAGHAIPAV
jgi:hypothetical protein